jgi:flagellar biosynthesis component FlhA
MVMIREVLYMPRSLRDRVKQSAKRFQQEELNKNMLAETDLRDVIIVCIAEALPKISELSLQELRHKVEVLKAGK